MSEMLYRSGTFHRDVVDEETRTIELSFSSDTPVERAFGSEVLEHTEDAVDLMRLNSGAPLLLEHDRTQQIGVVERAYVDEEDKKGRAVVRFSRSQLGEEIFQDVRDGIRSLVSVGYQVARFVTEKADEGLDTYRAVSWQPLEISLVSVPADASVGVGRGAEESSAPSTPQEEKNMEEPQKEIRDESQEVVERNHEPQVRVEVRPDKRASEIAELGKRFDASSEAVEFIASGKSADDFKEFIMDRSATAPIEAAQGDDEIGMS